MIRKWWRRVRWAVAGLLFGWGLVHGLAAAYEALTLALLRRAAQAAAAPDTDPEARAIADRVEAAARAILRDPGADPEIRGWAEDILDGRKPWGLVDGRHALYFGGRG